MVQLLAGQLASLIKKRKPKRKFRQRGIKKLSIITAAKKKMKCVITSREVIKSSILTARVAVKQVEGRSNVIVSPLRPMSSNTSSAELYLLPLFA